MIDQIPCRQQNASSARSDGSSLFRSYYAVLLGIEQVHQSKASHRLIHHTSGHSTNEAQTPAADVRSASLPQGQFPALDGDEHRAVDVHSAPVDSRSNGKNHTALLIDCPHYATLSNPLLDVTRHGADLRANQDRPGGLEQAVSAPQSDRQRLLRRDRRSGLVPDHDARRPHPDQQRFRDDRPGDPRVGREAGIQVHRHQDPAGQPRPRRSHGRRRAWSRN